MLLKWLENFKTKRSRIFFSRNQKKIDFCQLQRHRGRRQLADLYLRQRVRQLHRLPQIWRHPLHQKRISNPNHFAAKRTRRRGDGNAIWRIRKPTKRNSNRIGPVQRASWADKSDHSERWLPIFVWTFASASIVWRHQNVQRRFGTKRLFWKLDRDRNVALGSFRI